MEALLEMPHDSEEAWEPLVGNIMREYKLEISKAFFVDKPEPRVVVVFIGEPKELDRLTAVHAKTPSLVALGADPKA